MRRAFVAHDHTAAAIGLAAGFAFQQHLHTAGQQGDFAVLTGDNVAEFLDGACQVGDLFFEFFHGVQIGRQAAARQATWGFSCEVGAGLM